MPFQSAQELELHCNCRHEKDHSNFILSKFSITMYCELFCTANEIG